MLRLIPVALLAALAQAEPVTVLTARGPVVGYGAADGNYTTFFGVPYAKVDEDNPFGKSLDYPKFETPFNATDSTIRCPQAYFNPGGVLQCLIMNIYVPHRADTSKTLPILVWFYGGGFGFGSAGEYGGQYLVKHDVIVITVNYRLGPYGFLCLDDPKVPGNQGMKDQIAALRWIRKNIQPFGGDPNKVTISGESYGGGGVDLHLYSSYETLFHRAIVQSGSILARGFYMKPDYKSAIKLAKQLGHQVNTTKEALILLAKDKPLDVANAAQNLSMVLTVCREKVFRHVENFVNKGPFHLKNDRVKNIPVLLGYNSKEGFDTFYNKPEEFYKALGDLIFQSFNESFVLDKKEMTTLSNIFKSYYLGNKSIGPESSLELTDFFSDRILNYPAEWSVNKYLEQGAKVYKYLFSYTGGPFENATGVGAYHTAELKYLFQWGTAVENGLMPPSGQEAEEQRVLRDRMTTMWTNFAKYGNPTPEVTALLPVTWQAIPLNSPSRPYLDIDTELTMKDLVYKERMAMWQLFWHSYKKKFIVY